MESEVSDLRNFLHDLQVDHSRIHTWQRWVAYVVALVAMLCAWYVSEAAVQSHIRAKFDKDVELLKVQLVSQIDKEQSLQIEPFAASLASQMLDTEFELRSDSHVVYTSPSQELRGYALKLEKEFEVLEEAITLDARRIVGYGDDLHNMWNILVFLVGCAFTTWLFMLR